MIDTYTDDRWVVISKIIDKVERSDYYGELEKPNIGPSLHTIIDEIKELLQGRRNGLISGKKYYRLIFHHDFAKAFFPNEIGKMTWYEEGKPYSFEDTPVWRIHLMKMVLEENPITYLKKFI